jgi:hypothetical protein
VAPTQTQAPGNDQIRAIIYLTDYDGSICCYQSAVAMRLKAWLACSKLTLFTRRSTTSWTTDSEHLFWTEFFFHGFSQYRKWSPKML